MYFKILIFNILFFVVSCREQYLFYDVTFAEGFNLRRDVYIRITNFVRHLNTKENWIIVLPPFLNVFHWNTVHLIKWKKLFDMKSLNRVHKVIEYDDLYIDQKTYFPVDIALILKNHPDTNHGDFSPKADIVNCQENENMRKIFNLFPVKKNVCVHVRMDVDEFQDFFNKLTNNHSNIKTVYIHDAEKLIHGKFSEWSEEYWTVRRSMVFSKNLRSIGNEFRKKYLNSTDVEDRTVVFDDWRKNFKSNNPAKGGPFIGAHLRRADFIWNREDESPTVEEIVFDLRVLCDRYNLSTVFMATDTTKEEKSAIKLSAKSFGFDVLFFYNPSSLHPAELAIIDQWVAAHGRAFIGTFRSTFTYRIFEERQILGFPPSSTHHVFCPDRLKNSNPDDDCCSKPTVWPVQFEPRFSLSMANSKDEL